MLSPGLGLLLVPLFCLLCTTGTAAGPPTSTDATTDSWVHGRVAEQVPMDGEIVSERTLTAKHFSNQDGTRTAAISSAPVHYMHDGTWSDIDTRILPAANLPSYPLYNETNNFHSYFPAEAGGPVGLKLAYEGADLTHWLDVRISWTDASGGEHPICDVCAGAARVAGNRVIFQDSSANLDVEFTVTNVGLARAIVLKQPPVCLAAAGDGAWLNIIERLVLPAGYYLSLGGQPQLGDFSATGCVEIRDAQGGGFVTLDPLRTTPTETGRSSMARSARRFFQFAGDSLYCYNQIPVECLMGDDTPTRPALNERHESSGVRATTLLRPNVAAWWTGFMDPVWFGDPYNNYGCGDADIIVGTPDLEPPFYEYRGWAKFDVSSIDGDVTDSRLDLYLFQVLFGDVQYMYVDYYSIDNVDPQWAHLSEANVLLLYADCQNGTQYYNNKPWYTWNPTWTGDVDLGPTADAHIENPPVGDGTWWAVGFSCNTPAGCPDECGEALKARGYNGGTEAPKLTVTYMPPCTPPAITSGATGGGTVTEGDPGPVTFTVTATGDPAPSYQWKRNGIDVNNEPDHIQGATTDTLSITNVELSDDGDYTCVATNPCGEDTSDPATLIVLPLGACCHDDGSCTEEGEAECVATYNGSWLGAGTTCAGQPDCNANGTPDACDIYAGTSTDVNGNGVPDECEDIGDLNCDDAVNTFDIDAFVLALTNPEGYATQYPDCDIMRADCSGDGYVNTFDIDPFVELLVG